MRRLRHLAAITCLCLLASGRPLKARDTLTMRVSPLVSFAPAFLTVQAVVETSDENRALEVIAESPDFYTSSQIPLNGAKAPRVSVFQFRDLPTGTYDMTGILFGARGQRAATSRVVHVGTSRR